VHQVGFIYKRRWRAVGWMNLGQDRVVWEWW